MTKRHKSRPVLQRPTEMPDIDGVFTSSIGDVQAAGLDLKAIRLDRIVPDPNQPRSIIPKDSLEELAASIREQGVIQPIEVDYDTEQDVYVLVHGERRWKAAQMAGLETIPTIIKPSRLDRATRLIRQLIENIQREDLNDVDRARALVALRNQMQAELTVRLAEATETEGEVLPDGKTSWKTRVTWSDVGAKVGLSPSRMTRLRALLELPDAIREDVRKGLLTEFETRPYRGLLPDQQEELHQAWREQGLTADQVKEAAAVLKVEARMPEPHPVAEVIALVTAPPPPPPPPAIDIADYVEPVVQKDLWLSPVEAEVKPRPAVERAGEVATQPTEPPPPLDADAYDPRPYLRIAQQQLKEIHPDRLGDIGDQIRGDILVLLSEIAACVERLVQQLEA